ncbi:MAG: prepilin-type N-terminal cleavage/methylation domain-containing protein [Nitrospirota bacterium]
MRNRNGFTLIEVMVAMTVLLIGVLGVMGMQYFAVTGNASSREMRIATTLNTEYLDQILATPYNTMVALGAGTDTPYSLPGFGGDQASFSAISGGVTFTRSWWASGSCRGLGPAANSLCGPAGAAPPCTINTTAPFSMVTTRTCWADKNGINHSVEFNAPRIQYP